MDSMRPAFVDASFQTNKPEYSNPDHAAAASIFVEMAKDRLDYLRERERQEKWGTQEAVSGQKATRCVSSVASGVATDSKNYPVILDNSEHVANVANVANGRREKAKPESMPLRTAVQPQSPYPVEAFGPFAGAVKALSHGMKVPAAMAGSSVLTTLAFCAQGLANVHMRDGRTIPTSLYCLTVGDSGDRKTALDSVVSQTLSTLEREANATYQLEMQAYQKAKEAYEHRPKKEKELFPFEEEPPKNPAMVLENVNAEGLFRAFKEGRPSLAIFSDEGGTLFGGNAFQKENALKSITFFSKLWDGSPVDKVRSGEGFSRLYDRRLSMHLMLQPAIAEKVLADELFQGQGFLPRFLMSWPQSLKGTRYYEENNVRAHNDVQLFYTACEQILRTPLQIDENTGAIFFSMLQLDADAQQLWVEHHNMIEKLLIKDGPLSLIYANASKCAEQSLRIAGVLNLAENTHARTITGEIMKNAILLAQWYLKEALRLRQNGVAPAEIVRAESLLQWLDDKKIQYFSVRLILRRGPRALRLKKIAEEAVRILEEHGQIRRGLGSVLIDGANTKTFWERMPCA